MRLRAVALLGVLVVCIAVLATPAAAKKLSVKTTFGPLLIIKDNPTEYLVQGKVIAKGAGCRFQRVVRLHVIHPNNTDTVIASRKTKSGVGLFSFRVPLVPSESVYVSTPAKEFTKKSGIKVHCATGRSVPQLPT
jgi:hypothetical protein